MEIKSEINGLIKIFCKILMSFKNDDAIMAQVNVRSNKNKIKIQI